MQFKISVQRFRTLIEYILDCYYYYYLTSMSNTYKIQPSHRVFYFTCKKSISTKKTAFRPHF